MIPFITIMSDPLSIAASIAGLVAISAKISSITNQLIASGKNVPPSIIRIREEMDQLYLIFGQVQALLVSQTEKKLSSRLSMLPPQLMNNLHHCVVVYSSLDKILSDFARLTMTQNSPSLARRLFMRIKWALWDEAEVEAIIEDLQRHKSSLHMMLTIIQWYVRSCLFFRLHTSFLTYRPSYAPYAAS